jgi:hypothetical protein
MKATFLLASFALAASSLAAAAPADNLVTNGNFEDGKGLQFYATTGWYNCGKGTRQDLNARTDSDVLMYGVYAATVNDRYDAANKQYSLLVHSQRTAYSVKEGDVFTINYVWRPFETYWQMSRDTIRFFLYATSDDKMNGPVVWSSTHDSEFFVGSPDVVKPVSQKTSPVTAAAAGKRLFVVFHGVDTVDGVEGATHFARVDNIVVTVSGKSTTP